MSNTEATLSVKQRQIARLLALLETLKVEDGFRSVERVTRAVTQEPKTPCAHLIVGDETVTTSEDDVQGYLVTYPIAINIIVSSPKDLADKIDALVAKVQAAIESDMQLSGTCRFITYTGDNPFFSAEQAPIGGNTLTYEIQYRRQRAKPDKVY